MIVLYTNLQAEGKILQALASQRFVPASRRVGRGAWAGIPQSLELLSSKQQSYRLLGCQVEQGFRNLQFEIWPLKSHSEVNPQEQERTVQGLAVSGAHYRVNRLTEFPAFCPCKISRFLSIMFYFNHSLSDLNKKLPVPFLEANFCNVQGLFCVAGC